MSAVRGRPEERLDVRKVLTVHARCALVGAALGIGMGQDVPRTVKTTGMTPTGHEGDIWRKMPRRQNPLPTAAPIWFAPYRWGSESWLRTPRPSPSLRCW